MIYVTKRDGRKRKFNEEKIKDAVLAAFNEVDGEITDYAQDKASNIASYISNYISEKDLKKISVEEIQDLVEQGLMSTKRKDVAKAFILYRQERNEARENTIDKTIEELLSRNNEYWKTENSNKNADVVTVQRDYLAGVVSTDIARRKLLPKAVCKAHDEGIIHEHDMDYLAQSALSNCFSDDTEFITSEGVKTFNDFYDGSPVVVRDKDGEWRSAVVHNFGKQILYTVTLQSGRSIKEIRCTRNHRWILKDGTVTENLQVGDSLIALPDVSSKFEIRTVEEAKAFCLGFMVGDGGDVVTNRGVRVHLCGHKKSDYCSYFEQAGYQISKINGTDDVIATNKDSIGKQEFLDSKMWRVMSTNQKIALFRGYYSADGCVDRNAIHTCDERNLSLILEIAPLAGYYIADVRHDIHDTPYKKNASLYTITFRKNNNPNNLWKVKKIKKSCNNNRTANVWCVIEPKTHTFTLANGIVTGNCCLINLEDMLQNGTVINNVKIDAQHRLSTAITVATQIITAVASSQYGGTTISLTHLAPFVRMSYDEYFNKYQAWGFTTDKAKKYANIDVRKEIRDSVQTFNYQINSMSTTNGQAPFISVNMYLGETDEYKDELALLIEEFLNQRIKGMKNTQGIYITPAFPKLLYVLEEDNIHKDSKFYYLTELAAKCTAKRMVPDYISEKLMKELKQGDCYPCINKYCA